MPNLRLEEAINDLENVYGSDIDTDERYLKINEEINSLRQITDPYYESDAVLSDEDLDRVLDGYNKLLAACDDYIKFADKAPDTGYGQGRLHCIKAIRGVLTEDMRSLFEAYGVEADNRKLLGIIQRGRSISAKLENPEDINAVGGAMSSRIPVRLKGKDGSVEEGFFTESAELTPYEEKMEAFKNDFRQYGEDSVEFKMAEAVFSMDFKDMRQQRRDDKQLMRDINNKEYRKGLSEVPSAVRNLFKPFVDRLDEDTKNKIFENEDQKKGSEYFEMFLEIISKASKYSSYYYMNAISTGIPAGENIDKRNSAMSTVAAYFGAGNIIAGSRSFEMEINGEKKKGTFQQKAKGADLGRLPEGHEMWKIGEEYEEGNLEAVDTPELKRQLSDLMVIDYICGNADRHQGNMLYKTENVDGKQKITGIVGIDNDMSFGSKNRAEDSKDEKMVNPYDMRIMRKATADRVLDLTPEKLDFLLKDKNFTKEELDNCHFRLRNLQDKLKNDIRYQHNHDVKTLNYGLILVVPDEDFKNYPIEKLGANSPGHKNVNYFGRVSSIPITLNDRYKNREFAKPEKEIKFADARAEKGRLNFTDTDTRTDIDLEKTAERIRLSEECFEILGSKWFRKDSGNYQWMKRSVEELKNSLDGIKKRYPGEGVVNIPKAEAMKMEAMFKQIRMSGENYVKTHPNPWTTSGKNRLKMARLMAEMDIHYGPELSAGRKTVTNPTSIEKLLKEEFPGEGMAKQNKGSLNRSMSQSFIKKPSRGTKKL